MYEEMNSTRDDGTHYLNKYLNSGNFFLRSNARTKQMMEVWALGYLFQSRTNGNQLWLNRLERLGYKTCYTPEKCRQYASEGFAAIKPHPNQYEGVGQVCAAVRCACGGLTAVFYDVQCCCSGPSILLLP